MKVVLNILHMGFGPDVVAILLLSDIQKTFTAVKWFIEGDIKGFFDNINHDVLIRYSAGTYRRREIFAAYQQIPECRICGRLGIS